MIIKINNKPYEITCLKKQVFLKVVYNTYKYDSLNYLLALRDSLNLLISYKQNDILTQFVIDSYKYKGVLLL